jgi:hypothetical protein
MSENTLTVTDNRTGKTYEIPIEHDTIPATVLRKHAALHAEQLAAINTIFAPLPDATAQRPCGRGCGQGKREDQGAVFAAIWL